MTSEKPQAFCADCEQPVSDAADTRVPCANCGGLARRYHVNVAVGVSVNAHTKLHAKQGRIRTSRWQPVREIHSGDDLHRETGAWSVVYRVIDRLNDWYEERIHDPYTGAILVDKAEPLSRHIGRGSAMRKS